jgi:bacterial/archaeal transporter family protein
VVAALCSEPIATHHMNDSFSIGTMRAQTTPDHRRRTQLLVLIAIATQVGGNVFLSYGLHRAGAIISVSPLDYIRALNLWTIAGIIMLSVWIITDLALLSRADLSFVLPVIASSFVLIAIVGHFGLGERVSGIRWLGILLISFGVLLAETTPDRTTRRQKESL